MALFGSKSGKDPKALWEQFYKLAMKNEWDKALSTIHQLKDLEPQNAQVYIKIGDVMQRTGDKHGAIEAYHKAAGYLQDYVNVQKALAIYKIILRLNPGDSEAIKRSRTIIEEMSAQHQGLTYEAMEPMDEASSGPSRHETLAQAFGHHPVFSAVGAEDVAALPDRAQHSTFTDGQFVIKEDEIGDSVFLIESGKARVTTTLLGKTFELAVLGQWDFFGEVGFLSGMPRTASVQALGVLQVIEMSHALLNEIVERNPGVLDRMADISHHRTKSTLEKLKDN